MKNVTPKPVKASTRGLPQAPLSMPPQALERERRGRMMVPSFSIRTAAK